MTDKLETFCRYQNTDEAREFREAIEERAETQVPEEVSPAGAIPACMGKTLPD